MYYITIEVDKDSQEAADETAAIISDILACRVVGCYPQFQTGLDNAGQVIIYTGHIYKTPGA